MRKPFTHYIWHGALAVGLLLVAAASSAQTLTFLSVSNGPNNAGGVNAPNVFVVGAGPSRVTYRLTNNTGTPIAAGATLTMDLPDGGSYVAGSVTGATQGSITNLNQPVFVLSAAIAPAGFVDISYQTTFGCAVIPFINGGGLTRDIGTLSSPALTLTPAATYNVVSAALTITGATNQTPTVNVGDSYAQTVTIRNGGLNSIVPAPVTLNLGSASGTAISAPSIGTLSGNTITFNTADITGTNLLNDDGDNQWESGEDLAVTYTVTVNSCDNLARNLTASWGDGTSTCQTSASFPTGVNIANTVPNLTASIAAAPLSSCAIDVPRNLTVTVTNNGTGPANSIRIEMLNHAFSSFNTSTPNIIDVASIVVNLPGGGTYVPGVAGTTVLGTIGNNAVNVPSNGCAIGQPGYVSVALPAGTILPAGQSLTVTYQLRYCDNNTCTGGINAADHGVILRYQNQCLNTTFSSNIIGAVSGPRIILPNFNPEAPALVQNGQCISVDMEATFLSNFTLVSTDYIEFSVALSTGFTYSVGSLVSPAGSTLAPGYPQAVGGRLVVRYLNPATINSNTSLSIRFGLCVNQNPCIGGTVNLDPQVNFVADGTCVTSFGAKRCRTLNVQVLCPCCPEGGVQVNAFDFRRTTVGLQDNDADGLPDVGNLPADPNFVKLNRYRPGDEMTATTNGAILSGNTYTNWNHVYATWNFAAGGGAWEPVGTAKVTIKDVSTNTTYIANNVPVTGTAPGTAFAANWDAATFSPALPAGFIYESGDLVSTEAVFRLTSTVSTNNQTAYGTALNNNTAISGTLTQGLYATQAANPPVNPTPINVGCPTDPTLLQGPNRYQCGPIVYGYSILGMNSDMFLDGAKSFNTACGVLETSFRYHGGSIFGSSFGGQFFPFEYRPISVPGTYTLTLPAGFEYVPAGSANADQSRLTRTVSNGIELVEPLVPMVPTVSGSPATGQVLTYNLASAFTVNGGSLVLSTESYQLRTFVALRPTCAAVDGAVWTLRQTNGTFLTWPTVVNPNKINLFLNSTGLSGANQPFIYNGTIKPNLNLSAAVAAVNIEKDKATWTLTLNNTTNNAASFSFITISNAGPFSNVVLMEGATTLTPNANGIYELGTTNAAATRTFTVMATLSGCLTGNLELAYGWDCGGYPTNLANYACEKFLSLSATPSTAGLDMTFDYLPNGGGTGIDLCKTVTVRADINSTLAGALKTVQYKVTLPTGMTYVPGSVVYTFPIGGAPMATAYNPTVMGNMLIFDVQNIAPALANGLSGVAGTDRNVRIDFQLTTDCNFTSGSNLRSETRGVRFCGDLVPIAAPLNKLSNPLDVNDLIKPYISVATITPSVSVPDCATAAALNISLTLSGGQTLAAKQDKTVVRLPAGMTMASWVCTSPNAFNCPNAPVSSTDPVTGETLLSFTYPDGIPQVSGQPIAFTVNVLAGPSTPCGARLYAVTHSFLGNALACPTVGGGFCPPKEAIGAQAEGTIAISKPSSIAFGAAPPTGCVNATGTSIVQGTVAISGAAIPAGGSITVQAYCGDGLGGIVGGIVASQAFNGPLSVGNVPFLLNIPAICTPANGVVLRLVNTACACNNSTANLPVALAVDITKPSITCPANLTAAAGANCTAVVNYPAPVATDNCALAPGAPVLQSGLASGSTFPVGITTVVWRATDAVGLTKTCSFRVIVSDTQAPSITCPTIAPVNTAPGTCSAVVTYANATATDNCTASPIVTRIKGPASGSTFAAGTTRLIFRATDAAGRSATCSVLVTVVDNEPPAILCPGNIVATGSGVPCRATVVYNPVTATDNCSGVSPFLLSGLASGSVFPAGATTNTWRAIASNGQTMDCSFTVTVNNCPSLMGGGVELREHFAISSLMGLYVVPNPADDRALAVVEGLSTEGGKLLLFDVAGRLVWAQKLSPVEGEQQIELPVGVLQQGAYQVVLRTSERVVTKPLIIVHR